MKVVFFGTPPFAAKLLSVLLEQGISVVAIITKPDKPQGRSKELLAPAVKEAALLHAPHIPLFQPPVVSAIEFAPTLADFGADLFVVVAYGEIIKQHLLDLPRLGCINVHASILPKYRGAAPIQRAIMNGEEETGVTIMHMVRKMDAGDIIRVAKVPIGKDTTYAELEQDLCQAAIEPLVAVLREYQSGRIPTHLPQDPIEVTYAPKIELEDCELNWNRPAVELHGLVRGVNPDPGAWCYVAVKGEKKRLKIVRTTPVEEAAGFPGTFLKYDKTGIVIACGRQALKIHALQLEGKRCMSAQEFVSGIAVGHLNFNFLA